MPKKAQRKCLAYIAQLEMLGHELRRPVADFPRDGIYELRALVSRRPIPHPVFLFRKRRSCVVSWDHAPSKNPEDDTAPPPYSTTKIINDLKNVKQSEPAMENSEKKNTVPTQFSIIALALSAVAIGIAVRKK